MTEVVMSKRMYHLQADMVDWCKQHIGDGGWKWGSNQIDGKWNVVSAFGTTFFNFVNPADATAFALRWCNKDD